MVRNRDPRDEMEDSVGSQAWTHLAVVVSTQSIHNAFLFLQKEKKRKQKQKEPGANSVCHHSNVCFLQCAINEGKRDSVILISSKQKNKQKKRLHVLQCSYILGKFHILSPTTVPFFTCVLVTGGESERRFSRCVLWLPLLYVRYNYAASSRERTRHISFIYEYLPNAGTLGVHWLTLVSISSSEIRNVSTNQQFFDAINTVDVQSAYT